MARLYVGVGVVFVSLLALACGGEQAQPTATPTAEVQAPTPSPTPTAAPTPTPEPTVETLAFIRDGDIWLIDADGSNRRRVTEFGGTDREVVRQVVNLQWLASGQEIAYNSPTTGTSALVSLDGQVLWEVDGAIATLWSPDGQLVAIQPVKGFTRIEDREGRSVWPGNDAVGSGSWSPDGSHFAIVEGSEIVVVSRDGTSVSRLHPGASPDAAEGLPKGACASIEQLRRFSPDEELLLGRPVFSPDGKTILVAVNCSFNQGTGGLFNTIIRELSLDGLINRPVPDSTVTSLPTPVFSPDGGRIALLEAIRGVYCPDGASALATMDLDILDAQDGSGSQLMPREIAQLMDDLATQERYAEIQISGRDQESPELWSPVGDAIVASFSATECVCFDFDEACAMDELAVKHRLLTEGVYLLRIDGVADERIADEFSDAVSWSPSGDLIAYASGEPDAPQIRVFDLVTREVTDLGPGRAPAWQPLPPEAVTLPWEGEVTDDLRIRSDANTASDTLGTLAQGTKVRVYGEAEGEEAEPGSGNRTWYRVIGGWVYSGSVER